MKITSFIFIFVLTIAQIDTIVSSARSQIDISVAKIAAQQEIILDATNLKEYREKFPTIADTEFTTLEDALNAKVISVK